MDVEHVPVSAPKQSWSTKSRPVQQSWTNYCFTPVSGTRGLGGDHPADHLQQVCGAQLGDAASQLRQGKRELNVYVIRIVFGCDCICISGHVGSWVRFFKMIIDGNSHMDHLSHMVEAWNDMETCHNHHLT